MLPLVRIERFGQWPVDVQATPRTGDVRTRQAHGGTEVADAVGRVLTGGVRLPDAGLLHIDVEVQPVGLQLAGVVEAALVHAADLLAQGITLNFRGAGQVFLYGP
ncbi:hypothetical protein D3C81_1921010 [compost metagenome]